MKIKPFFRKLVYTVPGAQTLWIWLNQHFGIDSRPDFLGWGMATHTFTPWHNGGGDDVARGFLATHLEMVAKVATGEIRLSQFDKIKDKKQQLQELMWRHYVVYWSAWYAANTTTCPVKNLVECGVCDGLTAYFAMSAVKGKHPFKSFLYDAWEGMKHEYLLASESDAAGSYAFLAMDNTKKNLAVFQQEAVFIRGYIPDSFATAGNPAEIVWLHIDLNSSLPTTAALEFFYNKVQPGGIILFDDYAWHSFVDTKLAVDKFFADKTGMLLPLPTGQAMFFKRLP